MSNATRLNGFRYSQYRDATSPLGHPLRYAGCPAPDYDLRLDERRVVEEIRRTGRLHHSTLGDNTVFGLGQWSPRAKRRPPTLAEMVETETNPETKAQLAFRLKQQERERIAAAEWGDDQASQVPDTSPIDLAK